MDEVKTTAISNTQLLCCDSQLLEGFLGRHQELAEPINAIMKSHIQCLLSPLPFLSSVKDSQLRLLAAMCRYEAFDANQTVFEENTFGSKLYIVLDGEAAIMSCVNNTRNNAQQLCRSLELEKVSGSFLESKTDKNGMIELATVKSGDYFGETALIADIPRTTTVKTKTKALFVTVDKLDFANFFKVCPIKESMMKVTIERMLDKLSTLSIPFLSGIPEEKFKDLRDSAKLHELSNGEVVFKQGDHGDRFYIVVHGQVKIETRTTIDEKEVSLPIPPPDDGMPRRMTEIGRLGAGKYFGEMALVTDKKRSATVLSHGKSILLSIDKMSFHNIIGSNTLALSEFGLRLLKRNIELHHLLGHPNGVPFFKSYLQQSHADENLDFWLRIKSFEEKYIDLEAKLNNASEMGNENGEDGIDDHDPNEDIWNEAKDIFVTFCDEFAQNQVNIPATMRIGLKTAIFEREDGSKLPFELFESAKKEIYRIMARDSFPRFKTSPEFKVRFPIHSFTLIVKRMTSFGLDK